jgi:hypothetical protein
MLAAGVTAEVLAAAWKAEIAKQEAAAAERRARDADRQRRHRESRDVTAGHGDIEDAPLEVSPHTPLPKTPVLSAPLNPPEILEEKREAIATCLKVAFPPPAGVNDEQWAAFRGQRKKKLNPRSYLLLCNKLAKLAEDGWPPGDLIDLAIERGWETVFEPRDEGHGRTNRMARHQPDGLSSTARAAISVFGAPSSGG